MPELPEVETVRRALMRRRPKMAVSHVWRSEHALRIGRFWSKEGEQLDRLLGRVPGRIERRGKHLLWRFARAGDDTDELVLLVHLGMTGRCDVVEHNAREEPHTHLRLRTEDGKEIRFVDARRFGGLRVASMATLLDDPPLSELGPEPLAAGFNGVVLARVAATSIRPLRDVLLDQRVVAGVGNIYAVEALYRAGLHPLLEARRLKDSAWHRLAQSVREVLEQGVVNKGTTLRDYRRPGGQPGRNAGALAVYGRAGERCERCGATIEGFHSNGRSGAYCPREQVRPRARRVA